MFTVGDRYYEARGGVKAIARILFVFDYLCDECLLNVVYRSLERLRNR